MDGDFGMVAGLGGGCNYTGEFYVGDNVDTLNHMDGDFGMVAGLG